MKEYFKNIYLLIMLFSKNKLHCISAVLILFFFFDLFFSNKKTQTFFLDSRKTKKKLKKSRRKKNSLCQFSRCYNFFYYCIHCGSCRMLTQPGKHMIWKVHESEHSEAKKKKDSQNHLVKVSITTLFSLLHHHCKIMG